MEAHTLSMFATDETTFLFNFLLDHAVLHSFSCSFFFFDW